MNNNQQVNNEMFRDVINMNEEDRVIFLEHYPRYRVIWDRFLSYLERRVNDNRRNMYMFKVNSSCNAG